MTRRRWLTLTLAALSTASVLAACGSKAQTFVVPSPSMEPTFTKGETVTLSPVPSTLKTGMIVVFKDPADWLGNGQGPGELIKRVIGVGGDRVKCCDSQGRVTINGKALEEGSYLPTGTLPSEFTFDVRVPAGHLWVMGDNRSNSADSRVHTGEPGGGFVNQDLVVGIVKK